MCVCHALGCRGHRSLRWQGHCSPMRQSSSWPHWLASGKPSRNLVSHTPQLPLDLVGTTCYVCVCMFALPSATFTMARGAVVHVCMYNYRPALCTSLAVLSLTDFDFPVSIIYSPMYILHTLLLSLSLPSPSLPLLLYLHHSSSLLLPHLFSLLSFPPPILSFFPLLFSPLSLSPTLETKAKVLQSKKS